MSISTSEKRPDELSYHDVVGTLIEDKAYQVQDDYGETSIQVVRSLHVYHIERENDKRVLKRSEITLFAGPSLERVAEKKAALRTNRGGMAKVIDKMVSLKWELIEKGLIDQPSEGYVRAKGHNGANSR